MKYFKLGQTVYTSEYGEGVVKDINHSEDDGYPILVEFNDIEITFTADGRKFIDETITLSQNPIPEIVNLPLEEEYVHFTFEDDLLGEIVISKDKSLKGVITYQDEYKVVIGNYIEFYKFLFRDYTFLGGKPCGKLLKN